MRGRLGQANGLPVSPTICDRVHQNRLSVLGRNASLLAVNHVNQEVLLISADQLAELLQISRRTISSFCSGEHPPTTSLIPTARAR
jgi:transcriptional regulator with XRE-family HTH domain